MKKRIAFLAVNILFLNLAHGQGEYRKSHRVSVDGTGAYTIYYFANDAPKEVKETGKTYVGAGQTFKEYQELIKFDKTNELRNEKKFGNILTMAVDIKQDKGKLILYPRKFKELPGKNEVEVNKIIDENTFFIDYGARRNIRIRYSAAYWGAMTLPFKVYLTAATSDARARSSFDVSVNAVYGYRWGKTRYYYLPHDDAGKSYNILKSVNVICGLSKVELSENNVALSRTQREAVDAEGVKTIDKIKGSYAAVTIGAGLGFHYNAFSFFGAIGADNPIGRVADVNWAYTRQLWLGLGLGFKLY